MCRCFVKKNKLSSSKITIGLQSERAVRTNSDERDVYAEVHSLRNVIGISDATVVVSGALQPEG